MKGLPCNIQRTRHFQESDRSLRGKIGLARRNTKVLFKSNPEGKGDDRQPSLEWNFQVAPKIRREGIKAGKTDGEAASKRENNKSPSLEKVFQCWVHNDQGTATSGDGGAGGGRASNRKKRGERTHRNLKSCIQLKVNANPGELNNEREDEEY